MIFAAAVPAGCAPLGQPPAPPLAKVMGPPPRGPSGAGRSADHVAPTAAAAPHPSSWLVNPDGPVARSSKWWPALAAARRFARAYMSYQIGELGPGVRRAIGRTCTAAFAARLLARRATLPPGVSARQVRQRLVEVRPLQRVPDAAMVLATVRSIRRGGPPDALELRLLGGHGGWRVAGMTVI